MALSKPLALLLALAALALVACGGDDDEGGDDGGGEPLSAEEYDAQTEAALESFANLNELSAPLANPDSVEQYVAGVRDIVSEIEGTVTELDAIEPPENVAALHDELIATVDAYGAAFPPVADAAEAGDETALQAGAEDLQQAALDFQSDATDLAQRFEAEGIELQSLAG